MRRRRERERDIKRKEIRGGDEFRKEDRPETPLVQLLLSFDVFLSVCKKGIQFRVFLCMGDTDDDDDEKFLFLYAFLLFHVVSHGVQVV